MQRTLVAGFIVALVVFAGCNSVFGGSSEPRETLTPAPVPTDEPTPTPVPQLAPGLTGAGIENGSALVAAHGSFLRNQSFTVRTNTTFLTANGTVIGHSTTLVHAGPTGEYFHISEHTNFSSPANNTYPIRSEIWWEGERFFVNQTFANGTTTYDQLDISENQTGYGYVYAFLPKLLDSLGTNNTVIIEQLTRNRTTLYRVQATDKRSKNRNIQLLVNSRGVIQKYTRTRQTPTVDSYSKAVLETQILDTGENSMPEPPEWVDEAMNRTAPTQPTGTTTNR